MATYKKRAVKAWTEGHHRLLGVLSHFGVEKFSTDVSHKTNMMTHIALNPAKALKYFEGNVTSGVLKQFLTHMKVGENLKAATLLKKHGLVR